MRVRTKCAFCDSENMIKFLDFGEVALAGGFLRPKEFESEKKYNLSVNFCNNCYGVQVPEIVESHVMFKDYFYFSSSIGTLKNHFTKYAQEIKRRYIKDNIDSLVVEIGCNDGVLLKPLANLGLQNLVGVDPAVNVVNQVCDDRVAVINDFFNSEISKLIEGKYGLAQVILANNVFAHIPDIQEVTGAIESLLDHEGVFLFEVHYLGKVIDGLQYDMIYHEHIYYYSLLSLTNHFEKYNLEIFDIDEIRTHAGSVRFHVCKKGSSHSKNVSVKVQNMRAQELKMGLNKVHTFINFASRIKETKEKLIQLLNDIKSNEKSSTIVGYGASGRANTMIQYCGIDHQYIDYMVDDAPAKKGFYTPGSHFLIKGSECIAKDPPDYLLIFAWSFLNEIEKRCESYVKNGGRLIVPLPMPVVR